MEILHDDWRYSSIWKYIWVPRCTFWVFNHDKVVKIINQLNWLFQTGYSVVSACVVTMRWKDTASSQASVRRISSRAEGIIYILAIACCGFAAGLIYRFDASFIFLIVAAVIAICSAAALYMRQVSSKDGCLSWAFSGRACFYVQVTYDHIWNFLVFSFSKFV